MERKKRWLGFWAFLALALAAALAAAALLLPGRGGFRPVVRFVVASDVHVGSEGDLRDLRLQKLLDQANDLSHRDPAYQKLDAVFLVGDLADNGRAEQLRVVKTALEKGLNPDETRAVPLMGNHEFYEGNDLSVFESVMGEGSAKVHKIINGYHFIGISPDKNARSGWDYNIDTYNWVEEQVAAAYADTGADKPIFVFQHVPDFQKEYGTCDHMGKEGGTPTLQSIYERYPNVVRFAGHIHAPIADEFILTQNGYTALGTGSLYYAARTTVNGELLDMPNRDSIAQAHVVEVDAKGRTRVRVWDIRKGAFIGEEFLLDSYRPEDFRYTADRFSASDLFFAEGAKTELLRVTDRLAAVSFSPVSPDSITARGYRLWVEDAQGNLVSERYLGWDYFNRDFETPLRAAIGGLSPETEYRLKISAVTSGVCTELTCEEHRLVSEPLLLSFRTAAAAQGEVRADVWELSLDSASGAIRNAAGAAGPQITGAPSLSFDASIGMDALTFAPGDSLKGFAEEETVSRLAFGFTAEAYLRVGSLPAEKTSLFSGAGFDLSAEGEKLLVSVSNGETKTLFKTIDSEHFYHLTAVYNGENLTLFVNGYKVGKTAVAAPLLVSREEAGWIRLGAPGCSVALARIYSEALEDDSARALFEPVRDKQDPARYRAPENDPEYTFWEPIDDGDSAYVSFVSADDTVHDHASDNASLSGILSFWSGSHLYKSKSHSISLDMKCLLRFEGTGFRYVLTYRGPADGWASGVDVWIDGQFYQTVTDLNGENLTSRYVALEVTGLENKPHEITLISHDGRQAMMDLFEIVRGE